MERLRTLPNVRVCESRVTRELLASELAPLQARTFAGVGGRCRVVVSGPASFNSAVKEMLVALELDTERITILSA